MLRCDVAIIGGGPAGSTVGCLLKKYSPGLNVVIFERERFPRDHVGESHLPAITNILAEMGAWDAVEAAGFPIKVGATFRWGSSRDLWSTDFLLGEAFLDEKRPAKYAGQRVKTAFQVDRSVYDKILLDHARRLGCQVYEQTKIVSILNEGDKVVGLEANLTDQTIPAGGVADGKIRARHYVDASGDSGILRRALDIGVESPTALRNIAIWKYWQNAEWAVSIGIGGTRIQIMSLDWGWLWFIPITPTRTSIGLVLPASFFKASGKTTDEIYRQAIAEEPLISKLLDKASEEPEISATRDWSFFANRMAGENWFLAGDACGFADPILSAGMTLAHTSGRKVAYSVLELERRQLNPGWIKSVYSEGHRDQIRHHVQFADFWYTSNKGFTELKDYCREIAETAGLRLGPEAAFRWLATGGFALEEPGTPAALTYSFSDLKKLTEYLGEEPNTWELMKTNVWNLNVCGAVETNFPRYRDGRIFPIPCLKKGPKLLPVADAFEHILNAMSRSCDSVTILEDCVAAMMREDGIKAEQAFLFAIEGIESMHLEGWIDGSANTSRPFIKVHAAGSAGRAPTPSAA